MRSVESPQRWGHPGVTQRSARGQRPSFCARRVPHPGAHVRKRQDPAGPPGVPVAAEGGRAAVLPLLQAPHHLHARLGGQAAPDQGERSEGRAGVRGGRPAVLSSAVCPSDGGLGCSRQRCLFPTPPGRRHAPLAARGHGPARPRVAVLQNGVVSLIECTLLEDPESTEEEGGCGSCSCTYTCVCAHTQIYTHTHTHIHAQGRDTLTYTHTHTPSCEGWARPGPPGQGRTWGGGQEAPEACARMPRLPRWAAFGPRPSQAHAHWADRVFCTRKPKGPARTWTTWTSRSAWSPRRPRPSPSSSWPRPGRRRQPGPATSAR